MFGVMVMVRVNTTQTLTLTLDPNPQNGKAPESEKLQYYCPGSIGEQFECRVTSMYTVIVIRAVICACESWNRTAMVAHIP